MTDTQNLAVPAGGYRPPAVSIRATYTIGEVSDELVVDIDQGPVPLETILGVIDALTEKRDAPVEVDITGGQQIHDGDGRVIGRIGAPTVTNPTGNAEPFLSPGQWATISSKEGTA